MKTTEQYFPVVLFSMLSKVVLTFQSVCEIPMCDHSYESYSQYFSVVHCTVYCPVQGGSDHEFVSMFISNLVVVQDNNLTNCRG